jgi:hypothetical protein
MDCFNILEKDEKCQMVGHWDIFAVGKLDIMKYYCSIITRNYGSYFNLNINNFVNNLINNDFYKFILNDKEKFYIWRYAPEIQLFEGLYMYCDNNNLVIDNTIKHFDILTLDH